MVFWEYFGFFSIFIYAAAQVLVVHAGSLVAIAPSIFFLVAACRI